VVAGSDDGKFFVWERDSTNVVRVFQGDESIVNCLQCHPSACILATSGIESVIRLWAPAPVEDQPDDNVDMEKVEDGGRLVADHDDVAEANQRRMRADPFETLLMGMGYNVMARRRRGRRRQARDSDDEEEDEDNEEEEDDGDPGDETGDLQCRQS